MSSEVGFIREVVQRITVSEDLEIHVSVVSAEGCPVYAEIRHYAPSIDYYGRGIVLPQGTAKLVASALNAALRQGLVS